MTARALVVQHTATETPGWLAEWLPAAGLALDILRPYAGDPLPSSLGSDALIVLGGPMGAYDDEVAPWLPATRELLRSGVARSVPVLGVCLGGQLLAAACGGSVVRGRSGPEIGVGEVSLSAAAGADGLFGVLPTAVPVLQWHYDEIAELPAGAVRLAQSRVYRNQAFRVGDRAWGLQFHLETPVSMVAGWACNDAAEVRAAGLDPEQVVIDLAAAEPDLIVAWRPVVERFAGLAAD